MKRLTAVLLALASFVLVGSSYGQGLSGRSLFQSRISWQRLNFRNTSASATARNPNWAAPYLRAGFTDSVVFRKGAAGLTTYDTTAAYPIKEFAFAPAAFASQATGGDTLAVPWLILRLSQDTTSFVSTLGAVPTAMDSFRVAAQVSADGVTWFNANGTPTRAFDAVYFTSSAEDGSQAVDLAGSTSAGPRAERTSRTSRWDAALARASRVVLRSSTRRCARVACWFVFSSATMASGNSCWMLGRSNECSSRRARSSHVVP